MATLTGYGLHELVWDTADEWVGDVFVASPADAEGRGIALTVKRNGAAADLSGASVYLLWRHRESLARGTAPLRGGRRLRRHLPGVLPGGHGRP